MQFKNTQFLWVWVLVCETLKETCEVRVKSQVRRREAKRLGHFKDIFIVSLGGKGTWNLEFLEFQSTDPKYWVWRKIPKCQISLETDALPYFSDLPKMMDSQKRPLPSDVTPCISMPVCSWLWNSLGNQLGNLVFKYIRNFVMEPKWQIIHRKIIDVAKVVIIHKKSNLVINHMKYKSLFILLYFWLLIENQKWNSNQWLLMLLLFQFWRLKLETLINQFIFKFLIFDFISWWNLTSQKIGCWGSPFLKRFPPVPSHLQPRWTSTQTGTFSSKASLLPN